MEDSFTRRGFLRLAAGAAAVATGVGCSSGSDKPKSSPSAAKTGANGERTLRIRPDIVRNSRRHQPQRGHQHGHHDGPRLLSRLHAGSCRGREAG